MSKRHRGIEIGHRSARSFSSSFSSSRMLVTGLRGGTVPPGSREGVIQPLRTASASMLSASRGLRPSRGGTSSATTRSRSVTRMVSPPAARRTYSLSLFFSVLSPTARTIQGSFWKLLSQITSPSRSAAAWSGRRAGVFPLRSGSGQTGPQPAIAAGGVVPEELAPGRFRNRGPAQDGVHRLGEPALRVRVVGGEHQRVLADGLDDLAEGQLALVELHALEELRPADVLTRLVLEGLDRVGTHLGQLVHPRGPEGQPAVADSSGATRSSG